MAAWSLLAILAVVCTLLVLVTLLAMSTVAEERYLSPRAMILGVIRARRVTPDDAEKLAARELARLLGEPSIPRR